MTITNKFELAEMNTGYNEEHGIGDLEERMIMETEGNLPSHTMTMDELEGKKRFFDSLFSTKTSEVLTQDGAIIYNFVYSTNQYFQSHIEKLARMYQTSLSYDEVMSDVTMHTWLVIKYFDLVGNGTWEQMLDGTDDTNLNMIFAKIIKTVDKRVWETAYDIKVGSFDGERVNLSQTLDSLNVTLDDYSQSNELLSQITHSFWDNSGKQDTIKNSFLQWFNDNRQEFLTQRQNEFIEQFRELDTRDGHSSNAVAAQLNKSKSSVNEIIQRIASRTLQEYAKVLESYTEDLQELQSLINEEDIAQWFKDNHNDYKEIITDSLGKDYWKRLKTTLRRKSPDTDIIYEADEVLLQHSQKLEKLNKENNRTMKRIKREQELVQAKPNNFSDVKVYDGSGNLKATQVYNNTIDEYKQVIKPLDYTTQRITTL